jgi:hypothetical protein
MIPFGNAFAASMIDPNFEDQSSPLRASALPRSPGYEAATGTRPI